MVSCKGLAQGKGTRTQKVERERARGIFLVITEMASRSAGLESEGILAPALSHASSTPHFKGWLQILGGLSVSSQILLMIQRQST